MARDPQFVLKYLEEVELLAEDVLADKEQIVNLDKKRNFNREALAALHKKVLAPPHSANKVWVNFGGIFLKMEKKKTINMIKRDSEELTKEINKVQNELKPKVNKLRDAQNQEELKGFNLTPLSSKESRQVVPNSK